MSELQKTSKLLRHRNQAGVSILELLIVVIVLAIVAVLALPQMMSSRRLFAFSSVQREFTTYLREARQMAMSERKQITFQYDDTTKKITVYGGTLGAAGTPTNRKLDLPGLGLSQNDIFYGKPAGASAAALGDGANITTLTSGVVEIAFEPDGSVLNGSGNPVDNALFLYHGLYPADTAFAVSILGSGGRVKVWNFNAGANAYVE